MPVLMGDCVEKHIQFRGGARDPPVFPNTKPKTQSRPKPGLRPGPDPDPDASHDRPRPGPGRCVPYSQSLFLYVQLPLFLVSAVCVWVCVCVCAGGQGVRRVYVVQNFVMLLLLLSYLLLAIPKANIKHCDQNSFPPIKRS